MFKRVLLILAVAGLSGCAAHYHGPPPGYYGHPGAHYGPPAGFGTVESVQMVAGPGGTSGSGAIVGAIIGGVIGHQFGGGRGNDVATVAGALGGAAIGNEVERSNNPGREYLRVVVRMENGAYRTVPQPPGTDLRPGDRVRVEGPRIYRY